MVNRPRFRHPLFSVEGLHEDDVAHGLRGYRWRSDDGRGQHAYGVSELRQAKPYVTRRPVTVLSTVRYMEEVTRIERRENLQLPAVHAPPTPFLPSGAVDDGKRVYIRTGEKIDWLQHIIVRDEETGIELVFIRDPPYRDSSGALLPAVPFLYDGKVRWQLKLGEFRDERFEQVQSDEHEEEQANA